MFIYILLLLLNLLFIKFSNSKNQYKYAFVIMTIMMLLCGLRNIDIGIDTPAYIQIFHGKVYKTAEVGFFWTIDFFKLFSENERYWLLYTSVLTYLPLWFLVKKESPLPVFSVLIFMISTSYFFPETMNLMRQSMAIPFVLFSFSSWSKNKKTHTIIYFLIAMLFHNSSIIVLPFLFLKNIRFSKVIVLYTLIFVGVLGILNNTFFINNFVRTLGNIDFQVISDDISNNLRNYSNYADVNPYGLRNWKGYSMRFFPLMTLCILLIPTKHDSDKYNFYFNIFFIGISIFSLLNTVHYGFRLVLSVLAIQIVVIPMAYYSGSKKRKIQISAFVGLMIVLYIYYLTTLFRSPIHEMIVPYRSWVF